MHYDHSPHLDNTRDISIYYSMYSMSLKFVFEIISQGLNYQCTSNTPTLPPLQDRRSLIFLGGYVGFAPVRFGSVIVYCALLRLAMLSHLRSGVRILLTRGKSEIITQDEVFRSRALFQSDSGPRVGCSFAEELAALERQKRAEINRLIDSDAEDSVLGSTQKVDLFSLANRTFSLLHNAVLVISPHKLLDFSRDDLARLESDELESQEQVPAGEGNHRDLRASPISAKKLFGSAPGKASSVRLYRYLISPGLPSANTPSLSSLAALPSVGVHL